MGARLARLLWALMTAGMLAAAPPTVAPAIQAPLLPGESLALAGPDNKVYRFGDTLSEGPMGGLAHLVWAKLEGDGWASQDVQFKCSGALGGFHCSAPKGHGRVDLARAMQVSCNLAILAWASDSGRRWLEDYGEGAARARLEDTFLPFLGRRMPPGEGLPPLELGWFGDGDLLRTCPEGLLSWLIDPGNEEALRFYRRLFLSFTDETFKDHAWWVDPENAPAPGALEANQPWAVGGNGVITAVLRLPPGKTRADALARFVAIMIPPKPAKKK